MQRWLRAGGCWIGRSGARLGMASLTLGVACGASDRSHPALKVFDGDPEGPVFYETGSNVGRGGATSMDSKDLMDLVGDPAPNTSGPITIDRACVIKEEPATLVRQPVDIIVLLDNSGSMEEEAAAVEANLNVNFASVLTTSGVDYRVILISRHRREPRTPGDEETNTSVCVQAPLSGLTSCDSAPQPVFSDRFRQYSTKIDSHDSFDVALDTYAPPFDDDEREEKFDRAPLGWSEWLRPGAKKVFLEVTDDDEFNEEDVENSMSAATFASELTRLAPEHFGSDPAHPGFVFHSIVGLVEKNPPTAAYLPDEPVTTEKCTGNDGDVTTAGETYQDLSRLTGGLRFPLCQFDAYDVVFQRIAEDVVLSRGVACDFAIPPPPPGLELDLDNVAIAYASSTAGTTPQKLGQASTSSACQADAFYIVGDRLNLCPEACSRVRSDPLAAVNVLFTCESQIIDPR